MEAIVRLFLVILDFYVWILIASAILSWLLAFDVINIRNRLVRAIWDALLALTEPVLMPIRRRLPFMGGMDLSPIVVIFAIYFIQLVIGLYILPAVRGY
jgi:YggT family protein